MYTFSIEPLKHHFINDICQKNHHRLILHTRTQSIKMNCKELFLKIKGNITITGM